MSARTRSMPRYIWQMFNGHRLRHEQMLAEIRRRDVAPFVDLGHSLRVLDLANGRLRPQYRLLQIEGHQAYGIDLVNRPQRSRTDLAYKGARWLYNRQLGAAPRGTVGHTLLSGDVGALPFANDIFDLATSVAAFEHFLDVPTVVAELHRVLRPNGIAWVCIHLFTSPSGGHNISFAEVPLHAVPYGIDPWDHLRKRRLPFPVPLNEWRSDEYLETFARHFQVIDHYCAMREGEQFLTPEIETELADYRRDELTCLAFIIVARKAL